MSKTNGARHWIIALGAVLLAIISVVFTVALTNSSALAEHKVKAQREFVQKDDFREMRDDLKAIRRDIEKIKVDVAKKK